MKRFIALILCLIMILSFCGCKKSPQENPSNNDKNANSEVTSEVESDLSSASASSNEETASGEATTSKDEVSSKKDTSSKDKTSSENLTSKPKDEGASSKQKTSSNKTSSKAETSSKKPTSSVSAVSSNKNTSSQTKVDDEDEKIVIDYSTVVEVDLCDDIIRGYLDATDPRNQYMFLSEYDKMVLDHQNLSLTWKPDGSTTYTLYIAEKADFSDAYATKIQGSYNAGNLTSSKVNTICYPGKTYYWKVLGQYNDSPRGGGKIHITNQPVRWITLDGVKNVRDMGGWKTETGKTINYGKIYRGSRLDDITSAGIKTIKDLGIKTDVDIRSTASWDSNGPVESTGLDYYFFDTSDHYDYILGSGGNSSTAEVKENYPAMFELLADESNYPIYLHCNYGNDRTGSMAFILNGLLGVTYEDLTRDYELTSYAFSHDRRWRGNGTGGTFGPNDLIQNNISNSNVDGRWGMMNKAFMESKFCTDGKLSTAIENFLLDAGVKAEHIKAYKDIMLG